jgi:hypothetical protein
VIESVTFNLGPMQLMSAEQAEQMKKAAAVGND